MLWKRAAAAARFFTFSAGSRRHDRIERKHSTQGKASGDDRRVGHGGSQPDRFGAEDHFVRGPADVDTVSALVCVSASFRIQFRGFQFHGGTGHPPGLRHFPLLHGLSHVQEISQKLHTGPGLGDGSGGRVLLRLPVFILRAAFESSGHADSNGPDRIGRGHDSPSGSHPACVGTAADGCGYGVHHLYVRGSAHAVGHRAQGGESVQGHVPLLAVDGGRVRRCPGGIDQHGVHVRAVRGAFGIGGSGQLFHPGGVRGSWAPSGGAGQSCGGVLPD